MCNSCLQSSRAKLSTLWTISVGILAAIFFLTPDEESAVELALLASTLVGKSKIFILFIFSLVSFASSLTIILRYGATKSFIASAYAVHITAFMFAFVTIGLLATDLAFTLKNRSNGDIEKQ